MSIPLVSRVQAWPARTWLLGLAAVIAGLALVLAGRFARPYTFHGSLIESPAPAPDFTLNDQHGQPFRLSDQAGKVVLLYFGYTACPDVCPTTLAEFKLARARLGPLADQARFVFVTIDPRRDTAALLRTYLADFDASFVGLTGTPRELQPAWHAYGVYVDARPGLETIDHTNRVYVIDTRGRLRLTYSLDTNASALADDVRELIGEARQ
ncbi:MAG: SCO family protein [Kouleothrix sp.]|jgi:protein SCO1/2|nr:SCO family protein [Kouleothrix sp.]